jgi:hypothetical protein
MVSCIRVTVPLEKERDGERNDFFDRSGHLRYFFFAVIVRNFMLTNRRPI